ncbi:MAG: sulfite exporter TauE/SafE family protein [Anaerolineae bacterium]
MNDLLGYIGLFIAAALGGGLNAIAGGGSLIAFPALVAFGVPLIPANATNSVALWPGSIGGIMGFWTEIKSQQRLLVLLLVPSLIGGLLGAFILVRTPPAVFKAVVPFLVLFATLLFAGRDWVNRFSKQRAVAGPGEEHIGLVGGVWGTLFQIAIATYGGFFGAGQSIMMMASFSLMGMRDIHKINGIKTALALAINGIAIVVFALQGLVRWDLGILMGVGGLIGGYVVARLSKRIEQRYLRLFVIVVGLVVSVWLFVKP